MRNSTIRQPLRVVGKRLAVILLLILVTFNNPQRSCAYSCNPTSSPVVDSPLLQGDRYVYYSDSYTYDYSTGQYTLVNPSITTPILWGGVEMGSKNPALLGKYLYFPNWSAGTDGLCIDPPQPVGSLWYVTGFRGMQDGSSRWVIIGNQWTSSVSYNKYTVSFQYTGTMPAGVPPVPSSYQALEMNNTTVPMLIAPTGWKFDGWSYSGTTVSNGGTFSVPSRNIVLTGTWSPLANTGYKIEFYKKDAMR